MPPPPPPQSSSRKRKRINSAEDAFPDIQIDDLELDENDLKVLDGLDSPEKLANGNYRCNHPCKDRTKCRHLCCKEGKATKSKKGRPSLSKNNKGGVPTGITTANNITPTPNSIQQEVEGRVGPNDDILLVERVSSPSPPHVQPAIQKPFFRRWTVDVPAIPTISTEDVMDIDDDDELPDLTRHFLKHKQSGVTDIKRQSEVHEIETSYSQNESMPRGKENQVQPVIPPDHRKEQAFSEEFDFSVDSIFQCVDIVD